MSQDQDQDNQGEGNQEGPELRFVVEGLEYLLNGAPKKTGKPKTVVTVRVADGSSEARVTDRVDPYAVRSWKQLAESVARTFQKKLDDVVAHQAVVLDECERAAKAAARPQAPVLTDSRRSAAERILNSPDLLASAVKAFERAGYVGEERTKALVYLIGTSRLLDKPLSGILMGSLATGKTELIDALLRFMPPESCVPLSRLTENALFYMGGDRLQHKLLTVDEAAGTAGAEYGIRTLQSRGVLRSATTVNGKAEVTEAEGPVALLSGTTKTDLNEENLSRCLELVLDDSAEQTRRVQDAQRRAASGEPAPPVRFETWQDVQRLLESMEVVIPFATKLDYPSRTPKDRRDNAKLLGLIMAHALLHQRQRRIDDAGRLEATVEDYRAIHGLLAPIIESQLDDLSPRAARLYRILLEKKPDFVTKHEVADHLACSYMTAKRAVDELEAQELLVVEHRRGEADRFSLVSCSILSKTAALIHPDALEQWILTNVKP